MTILGCTFPIEKLDLDEFGFGCGGVGVGRGAFNDEDKLVTVNGVQIMSNDFGTIDFRTMRHQ